jgi:hypothetical protein
MLHYSIINLLLKRLNNFGWYVSAFSFNFHRPPEVTRKRTIRPVQSELKILKVLSNIIWFKVI